MGIVRLTVSAIAGAAVVLVALIAPAVSAPASTATTSGMTSAAAKPPKSQQVSVLYTFTAARGALKAVEGKKRTYELTLRATSDHVTWFTDRPARLSGFLPTPGFVSSWAGYGFKTDAPNVALVVREPSGATDTVVAVMTRPKVTAKGVFTARLRVLTMDQAQGVGSHLAHHAVRHDMKVPSRFTSASLFIDDVTGTYVGTSPTGCLIQPYAQCPGANLSVADLSEADLSNAYLTDANLSYTNLSGANVQNANLARANLSNADSPGVNLSFAVLTSVDLSYTDLTYARLVSANLADANLTAANLTNANLSSANLTNYAIMTAATLTGATLTGTQTDSTTTCPNGSSGPCW